MSFNGITHSFTNMEYIYYSKVAHFFRNVHCNAHIVYLYNDIKCIKASFLPHCNRFVTSVGLTEYLISAFFNFYCASQAWQLQNHFILEKPFDNWKRVICNYHLRLHKLFHKTVFRYAPMDAITILHLILHL